VGAGFDRRLPGLVKKLLTLPGARLSAFLATIKAEKRASLEMHSSVTIFSGRPYFFKMRLRSFSAAALSRFEVTTVSNTSLHGRRRARDKRA
jgi:hypothetical protein